MRRKHALLRVRVSDKSNNNTENVKTDDTSDEKLSDNTLSAAEDKPPVEVTTKISQNNQIIQNIENNNEMRNITNEDMSQPMDEFNGSSANNTDNNTDMTDCSDRTNDLAPEVMDATLSQSDLSEPMDED